MSDQNFIKGTVFFNGRDYNVREDEMEVFFTDMSDNKFKIDFSFSKDLEDNRKAGKPLDRLLIISKSTTTIYFIGLILSTIQSY